MISRKTINPRVGNVAENPMQSIIPIPTAGLPPRGLPQSSSGSPDQAVTTYLLDRTDPSLKKMLNMVCRDCNWDKEKFQCIELMEAAVQLAANLLKADYTAVATRIFRKVDEKTKGLFDSDDERTT